MNARVLVVDDEQAFCVLAQEALVQEGFDVRTAPTLARALVEVHRTMPDIVLLDRRLPDGDGIEFLATLRAEGPAAPLVVVVTAYGDVENAVAALRAGAWDYLTKPVPLTDLVVKLRKVMEARTLRDRLALARQSPARPPRVNLESPALREVLERLRSLSQSPWTPAFIVGASGVGKQFVAEALHEMTCEEIDKDAPFVEVNCAAFPEHLVESELFGHEKGAFTDARATRRGLIELADGGTLFLDELTELPLTAQAKLLKFLDTMRFRRLGGEREIEVTLRVVAATNQNVEDLVAAGTFREDLFQRLAVFLVTLPRLADHREDVPVLARAFVQYFGSRIKKRVTGLSPGALRLLEQYAFPGNVRELRNIIERGVILATSAELTEREIVLPEPAAVSKAPVVPSFFGVDLGPTGTPMPLEDVEKLYVARVLDHCEGRRMAAAQMLGISYPTFLKRLRELGLDSAQA
jgi:two-component system, NtrC family, response regulator AtoC